MRIGTTGVSKLFVSFSGGETSGYMTYQILNHWHRQWDEILVGFANTGQENWQTLAFVDRCDKEFGFKTVWIEADVKHGRKEGTGHKVVSYATANTNGVPFEEVIKKYGIPNAKFPHCTRELKLNPMRSYLRSIGWEAGTYDTGIRADEAKRRSGAQFDERLKYPLLDTFPTTKADINRWWAAQPFRLDLLSYEGNCMWCWKKSLRKLLAIMDGNPEKFDFPGEMERLYGLVGPEFKKTVAPGYQRVFFRGGKSTQDLRDLHQTVNFVGQQPDMFMDAEPDGCVETCEIA
jgi:hypothetical protein